MRWSTDIEADNAWDAAKKACAIQRDTGSTGIVFDVWSEGATPDVDAGEVVIVTLPRLSATTP